MSQEYAGYRGLLSPSLVALFLGTFFTMIGFYLLLSVVPLYTESSGGRSSEAGLATAAFMLSTVGVQVAMPAILRRFGYKRVLIAGQALLGLPTLAYSLAG
ncbi:MFS transporter, partial [Rubrobacter aplysinae]|uniref:MFS transporter n=1 Tax=Rubrobacter aplysinae TaxID=909625 RepID=UPI001364C8D9